MNNKRTIFGWTMYDWANSVYSLVISSAIFPVYYNAVTSTKVNGIVVNDKVDFLGMKFVNTALYSYSVSFAFLVIAIISPMLAGIADYSNRKKTFMQFFCYLGSAACIGLYFFDKNNISLGIILSTVACIGFAGSIVFYNAFLPEIASTNKQDAVSARGFSMGYIGSTVLLLINLSMIIMPQWYGGISSDMASRISFLMVGIWWAGFAQITFNTLPKPAYQAKITKDVLLNGYKEIAKVWQELTHQKQLKRFLIAFFFYNMSVQTVMYVATLFGDKEIKMKAEELIATIFIIQIVAIGGAYLFSYLSRKLGNIRALSLAVTLWVGIGTASYFVYTAHQFMAVAVVVGLVMGGIQSLSRSTFSKLMPKNTTDTASYFSFYDVTEKISIVMGTFLYGFIEVVTGSMRFSVLFFTFMLVIGLVLVLRVKKVKDLNKIVTE